MPMNWTLSPRVCIKLARMWGERSCPYSSGLSDPTEGKNNNSHGGAHPTPSQQQVWEAEIFTPFAKNLPLQPQVHYLTITTSYTVIFSEPIKYWLASAMLSPSWLVADILGCGHPSLSVMSASGDHPSLWWCSKRSSHCYKCTPHNCRKSFLSCQQLKLTCDFALAIPTVFPGHEELQWICC